MADIEIYNIWTTFINSNEYKVYFLSNNEIWLNKLDQLKEYINEHNKLPSTIDKNPSIKQL